ncbi:MAG: polyisoprenoid-binding protein YceI [Glaciecola sp.]|jgi:polyisoprenoid-binding protein YceI
MKFIKISFVAITLMMASFGSWVFATTPFSEMPAGEYTVDLSHASVVWKVSHLGLSDYVARFADFDASIQFDPSNIAASKVSASINPMSIQTAYPNASEKNFDNILATDKGWFNAGKFASIEFASTSIEMTGEKTAVMLGDLRFLGVSKSVMISQPFSRMPTIGFSANTTIKRSDWGMSKNVPNIGDDVEVMIEGEFAKTE